MSSILVGGTEKGDVFEMSPFLFNGSTDQAPDFFSCLR